jgi:hypothetical protein
MAAEQGLEHPHALLSGPHEEATIASVRDGSARHAPGGIPRPGSPQLPQHQIANLLTSRRTARPGRVSPVAGNETTMPGQQSSWRDHPTISQRCRKQPGKCCQDRSVGPVRPGLGHLAAEHHDLVKHHDQVQQTERHGPRSCLNSPMDTNGRSTPVCRILKRYTPLLLELPGNRASAPSSSSSPRPGRCRRECPAPPRLPSGRSRHG